MAEKYIAQEFVLHCPNFGKPATICVTPAHNSIVEVGVYKRVINLFKVFRYSFSETRPMFFNRLKSDFVLVLSLQTFHQ